MRRYDPAASLLAGMPAATLQARLAQMQADYLDLSSGRKVESANYSQGDGGKGVTYTKASLPDLANAIRLVQAQLGVIDTPRHGRRRVYF